MKTLFSTENLVISLGYVKEGYGYKKVTIHNTHWITFYDKNRKFQMYAYYSNLTGGDEDFEKIYDTGMIKIPDDYELNILIKIMLHNHQ